LGKHGRGMALALLSFDGEVIAWRIHAALVEIFS
jgi:hypothetical protein